MHRTGLELARSIVALASRTKRASARDGSRLSPKPPQPEVAQSSLARLPLLRAAPASRANLRAWNGTREHRIGRGAAIGGVVQFGLDERAPSRLASTADLRLLRLPLPVAC